jgi:cytochrome c6
MKTIVTLALALSATCLWLTSTNTVQAAANGEELFKQHCSACHANGGNIINPQKSLHKATREANKVNTVEAIIGKMRNPGPGMSKFDTNFLPDSDAKAIAEYILKTF